MLGGLAPVLIFQFSKLTPEASATVSSIPIVSDIVSKIGLPPIPIYLSRELTGIVIDAEEKHIDIETKTETKKDGSAPDVDQKGLTNITRINMRAQRDSVSLTLLVALCDQIVPLVTSQEYSLTYISTGATIFNGLLHSFAVTVTSEDDLYNVIIEISKTTNTSEPEPEQVQVEPLAEPVNLSTGISPTAPLRPPIKGPIRPTTLPVQPPIRMGRG